VHFTRRPSHVHPRRWRSTTLEIATASEARPRRGSKEIVQRLPLLIALATVACSPSAPPAGPAPARGATVRRDPTPPPRREAAAEAQEPVAGEPAQSPPQQLAADCEGSKIDLRDVFDVGVCQVEGRGDRIPASIRRSIEPGVIEVRAGRPASGAIQLENTGSEPADVFLSLPCELDDQLRTWIENPSNGQPVDTDRTECEGRSASGCLATVHHIRMPPGGTARFPFEAATAVRAWDERCETHRRTGPVPRGRYKLRVRALFLGATVDGEIVIR
jgi:hypothetical protein